VSLATSVAVTGARGRLGRALIDALNARDLSAIGWGRPDYELDDPTAARRLVDRDRPATVIHAAAWTDVDGCAREPDLATRRNGVATGELAIACAERGLGLVLISTNEVFDGERTDGRGYVEDDEVRPINTYGQSKLSGERLARQAYAAAGMSGSLWIIRTAWLYGPPGNDFPTKILAAAERLTSSEALRVVTDEIGSPTYTRDLAPAILDLVSTAPADVYHLTSGGHASRFEVALAVLERCKPGTSIEPISRNEFVRASRPPGWSVLDTSNAARYGVELRPWRAGLGAYLGKLC
jgi:dTDP-4-dehydrorhamnose reductase